MSLKSTFRYILNRDLHVFQLQENLFLFSTDDIVVNSCAMFAQKTFFMREIGVFYFMHPPTDVNYRSRDSR
jgi:hypothetical protein